MNRRVRGMTLFELIVVMTIVGILAAIGYPTYMQYTLRSNRMDGLRALQLTAQALERCYSQAFTYAGCAAAPVGTSASPNGFYNVTVAVAATPPDYTITAVPNGPPQDADTKCQQIILDATAGQSAFDGGGTSTTQTCWGSN